MYNGEGYQPIEIPQMKSKLDYLDYQLIVLNKRRLLKIKLAQQTIKKILTKGTQMPNFIPDEKTIKIMKNFADINPSMLIEPDKIAVINNAKSVVARYTFDTPFDFAPFGLYNTVDALGFISALGKPTIEIKDTYINIIGINGDKVKYFTQAENLLTKVPLIEDKFIKVPLELDFILTADKLAIIDKMADLLKAKYIFFETEGKQIRITVGDEITDSSINNYDICIDDNIKVNSAQSIIKILITDFKILPGEYEIKINPKITKWANLNGVIYYISTAT
jgi:hypothetical protein